MQFGSWQDAVIAVVQWVFVISLLPTIFHPTDKPTLSTAALTAISLFIMASAMATLPGLRLSAASVVFGGIDWTVLACQRYRINMRRGEPLFRRPGWMGKR
jgi:predicted cobalt transporter CbtA